MARINRDTIIAIFLLLFCGVLFWASLDIRDKCPCNSLWVQTPVRIELTILDRDQGIDEQWRDFGLIQQPAIFTAFRVVAADN